MPYATLRNAMRRMGLTRRCGHLVLLLGTLSLLPACGSSERLIVQDPQTGIVFLTPFATRGTTGRYPGARQPIQASHPIALSPEHVARILSGVRIGIIPADPSQDQTVIKPAALLSDAEIARIAPGISSALRQANPDQYVRFLVGADPETTEGALYIDGQVLRFTLNRYRSSSGQRDRSLSIYALSFSPESERISDSGGVNWLSAESGNPRLAVAYSKLAVSPTAQQLDTSTAGERQSATRSTDAEGQDMKAIVERQAEELKSMKEELESLKKEMRERPAAPPSPH